MDISIRVEKEPKPRSEFSGSVEVGFRGRYDGVVVNTQVLDSNELVLFKSCNGKKISKVARLFVPRDDMEDSKIEFTALLDFVPKQNVEIKFRASIIEQHKEIESDIAFSTILAA